MKVFFDTNVYIAEALLGSGAQRLVRATLNAQWRIFISYYVLDEIVHVLVDDLGFSKRLAQLIQQRIMRRAGLVRKAASATVPDDPKDSPILQAALGCAADYLVTNDRHLLALNPFKSLRIISMDEYMDLLRDQGYLK